MASDYKVKDISLSDWGIKEIAIAETEMPGLMALREEYKNNKPLKAITILALRHYWFKEFKIAKNLGKISDRNRSFWWMFILYFYAIVDAYVDSHLDRFPEVDENNLNNSE